VVTIFSNPRRFGNALEALWTWFQPKHWPVLFGLTILCLVIQENYPFSNFPMYSSFAKNSYYIYLADAKGQALATTRFGLTTPGMKKIFESKRRTEIRRSADGMEKDTSWADRAAGASLLRYLERLPAVQSQKPSLLPGLQVRRVNLLWKAGRIESATKIVAQRP
jgi:hypothetical protein